MPKVISKGICNFCETEVDKSKMSQHLKYCKQRKAAIADEQAKAATNKDAQKTKLLHIVVEGRYNPQYWMHLELPEQDTFDDLDQFLRDIWLECCGHLSAFRVGNISYSSQTEDMMWGMSPFVEGEEEDEEDVEEEDEDIFDPELLQEMENMPPTEATGMLLEVLTQEFQANPLEMQPEEFDAKLKELLATRMQQKQAQFSPQATDAN